MRKPHNWTPQERQIILDNSSMSPKEIKRTFFRDDKTITPKRISMQAYNLSKGKISLSSPPRTANSSRPVSRVKRRYTRRKNTEPVLQFKHDLSALHTLEVSAQNLAEHRRKIESDNNNIRSLIAGSNYSKDVKNSLFEFLNKAGYTEVKNKHQELISQYQK